jgi:hypothetical protein
MKRSHLHWYMVDRWAPHLNPWWVSLLLRRAAKLVQGSAVRPRAHTGHREGDHVLVSAGESDLQPFITNSIAELSSTARTGPFRLSVHCAPPVIEGATFRVAQATFDVAAT